MKMDFGSKKKKNRTIPGSKKFNTLKMENLGRLWSGGTRWGARQSLLQIRMGCVQKHNAGLGGGELAGMRRGIFSLCLPKKVKTEMIFSSEKKVVDANPDPPPQTKMDNTNQTPRHLHPHPKTALAPICGKDPLKNPPHNHQKTTNKKTTLDQTPQPEKKTPHTPQRPPTNALKEGKKKVGNWPDGLCKIAQFSNRDISKERRKLNKKRGTGDWCPLFCKKMERWTSAWWHLREGAQGAREGYVMLAREFVRINHNTPTQTKQKKGSARHPEQTEKGSRPGKN